MFDLDNWAEIFSTIKKNKLRTFLAGFSIAWGILMFCILLTVGNAFRNGMLSNFGSRSVNSVQFWGRQTSVSFEGLPEKRPINLDEKDYEFVKNQLPEAVVISPTISTNLPISYGLFNSNSEFQGVNPEFTQINGITIKDNQGRFINQQDMREMRKVAVINSRIKEVLFNNEDPLGKMIIAGGLSYTVIGVCEEDTWGSFEKAYIPLTTAQQLYSKGYGYDDIAFTVSGLDSEVVNEAFETRLRKDLANIHHYDPEDKRAVGIWNQMQNYLQFLGIFNGISAFIWIIGVGTLIAGIVGISNIMLITVRERTKEIGIKKALGAKPRTILMSIIMESVFITSISGYIGLFFGVGFGEVAAKIIDMPGMEQLSMMFKNPAIEVSIAAGAMLVLIISGVLAGYFPALKAVRISPIEAMRAE